MPNVEVDVCESCGRKRGEKHRVTTPRPSVQTMESWMRAASASLVEATDGCVGVDPDGECEHGHLSWLRQAMLI